MSETRKLADVCFARLVDWLCSHSLITVLGDTHQFLDGMHLILLLSIDQPPSLCRSLAARVKHTMMGKRGRKGPSIFVIRGIRLAPTLLKCVSSSSCWRLTGTFRWHARRAMEQRAGCNR